MQVIDMDRKLFAEEKGYDVTICSLQPLTCSPKNNMMFGRHRERNPPTLI